MKKITLFLLLVAFAGMVNATVYYVSSTATGNGSGTSWENAFTSPAAAIASTTPVSGDEIWVKQGTYVSATTLGWETGQNFYGGFVGTETLRSQRSTDATLTILEGNNTNKVLNAPSMASATTWDGFTIQKGLSTDGGGGAFLQKNAILSNCIFQNNKATNYGGGAIFIQGVTTDADSIKVINCVIKNNTMTYSGAAKRGGGGIYVKAGSYKTVIRGCTIEGNTADGLAGTSDIAGGGVYLCDGTLEASTIKNNIITNRAAASPYTLSYSGKCQGGGVFIMPQVVTTNPITVRNCTVSGNYSEGSVGGGISIDPLWGSGNIITAPVSITKTIITNNWAYKNGGGIMTDGQNATSTSNYVFTNCVIANNESSTVAAGGGGAFINNVAAYAGTVSFANCTVANNKMLTTNYGGAGIFYNNIKSDITNCVFWGNGGVTTFYNVKVKNTLTANKLINCVFDSNFNELEVSPVATPADLTGKVIVSLNNSGSAGGTLYANFVSPTNFVGKVVSGADQTSFNAANWSITHASACVNKGATLAGVTTDIAGLARPQASAYDIGAYELRAYTITASANNGSMGSVSGAGSKVTGSTVSLVATANSGYHFVNWTESAVEVSTNTSLPSFTSSVNRTLVANFEPNTVPVNSGTTNAADITCTTCDVTVASGAELTVGATKTLKSVSVAAGGKLTITAGTLNATNGITLESDANGTATMLQSGTLTGTVYAKQYLGSARNWYVSSPVSSAEAPATNMDYYYEYMEGGNNNYPKDGNLVAINPGETSYWKYWATGTTMEVGKGYIAKANDGATVQFSGTPNNGNITTTFDLTRNDAKGKGFNLVGNPYPSYIDWTDVATANPNLENTYYYRTKNTNITNTYTFVTWNGAGSGSYVVSNGLLPVNTSITRFIPPTQAFWVRVKTGTETTKMYFNNGMREHRDDDYNLMKVRKQDTRTSIRLQLHKGTQSDEMLIYLDEEAINNYDAYDSPKMMNNSASVPDLYSKAGNERLVINGLNAITDNMELPLGFSLNAPATLKFKAVELSNLPEGTKLYLRDKQEITETELLPETEYNFSTTTAATNNESRFSLLFRAPGVTTEIDNLSKTISQVFVNASNQITIIAPEKSNYAIYNAVGMMLENGVTTSNTQTLNFKLQTGVYVVKVNNQSTRVIIK